MKQIYYLTDGREIVYCEDGPTFVPRIGDRIEGKFVSNRYILEVKRVHFNPLENEVKIICEMYKNYTINFSHINKDIVKEMFHLNGRTAAIQYVYEETEKTSLEEAGRFVDGIWD